MERCETCRHWASAEDTKKARRYASASHRVCLKLGNIPCGGYADVNENEPTDEAIVEGDEGWGIITGPKFGCVQWLAFKEGI